MPRSFATTGALTMFTAPISGASTPASAAAVERPAVQLGDMALVLDADRRDGAVLRRGQLAGHAAQQPASSM